MKIESVRSFPTRVFTFNSREAFLQTMSKFILILRFILDLRKLILSMILKSRMNLEMRINFDMVCKKSLPAVNCEHPGRKRLHRFNVHMYIKHGYYANKWIKTLTPAQNRSSNILLHLIWSRHHLLCFITNAKRNTAGLSATLLYGIKWYCVVPHSTVTVAYGITWPCIDLIEVILSDLGRVKILKSGMLLLYGHMDTVAVKSFCSS